MTSTAPIKTASPSPPPPRSPMPRKNREPTANTITITSASRPQEKSIAVVVKKRAKRKRINDDYDGTKKYALFRFLLVPFILFSAARDIFLVVFVVAHDPYATSYQKPKPVSSRRCLASLKKTNDAVHYVNYHRRREDYYGPSSLDGDNDTTSSTDYDDGNTVVTTFSNDTTVGRRQRLVQCVGCSVATQEKCPTAADATTPIPCQELIDEIYRVCDGVSLPEGYFYDQENKISGSWNDPEVKRRMSIAAARCGCNFALRASSVGWMVVVSAIVFAFVVAVDDGF